MDKVAQCQPIDARERRWRRLYRIWLYSLLLLCLAIVMVGGATRLLGAGLSITEWKPIHGVIPPRNLAEWQEEFLKYQQIAQYQHVNKGMSLDSFKSIYWWEWSHRFFARFIGIVGSIPFFYLFVYYLIQFCRRPASFWRYKGRIVRQPAVRIAIIVPLLVALQGVIGWWMVASGIGASKLVSVSQYRLSTHLIAAALIILVLSYLAIGYSRLAQQAPRRHFAIMGGVLVFAIMLQLYLGALVAGSHAGFVYNSWPLMDNQLIPDGLWILQPLWLNFFENRLMIQFSHRFGAYIILALALLHWLQLRYYAPDSTHARRGFLLLLLLLLQALLGIITLLTEVPVHWGLIHQFVALLVLVFATSHWRAMKQTCAAPLAPISLVKDRRG